MASMEQVSTTTDTTTPTIAIDASRLWVTSADHRVIWQENEDLSTAFTHAWKGMEGGLSMPGEGDDGTVAITLSVDGEPFDEVHTQTPPGGQVTHVEVIGRAIAALTLTLHGIQQATR